MTEEELAEIAYCVYWERVTPKDYAVTPFKKQGEIYKEDWRKVVRQILEKKELSL